MQLESLGILLYLGIEVDEADDEEVDEAEKEEKLQESLKSFVKKNKHLFA